MKPGLLFLNNNQSEQSIRVVGWTCSCASLYSTSPVCIYRNMGMHTAVELAERHTQTHIHRMEEIGGEREDQPTDPTTPWPYLQRYMRLVESSDKKYVFRCLLCNPKTKLLSTSKTSNTNLRTHIQVNH